MHQPPAGYDIDGDGQIDVREMRMAKFLDEMIQKRTAAGSMKGLSEIDLQQMRQDAGRLLMAKEFIERNQGQLWRYGSVFAEKNDDQSAEFIAAHKKFPKLMAFLESSERQRVMRSSRHVRGTLNEDPYREDPSPFHRQTWVESVRKVNNASVSKFPLPDLQPKPKPKQSHSPVAADNNDELGGDEDVFTNAYGAIDVDGDGVVDFDEMKLHIRLKEATLDDPAMNVAGRNGPRELRKLQQLAGRRMMARDFVTRNDGKMWLYDFKYKGQATEDVIEQIASSEQFGRDYNRLRAKERVLALKSSMGVAGCIAQMPAAELPNDPTNTLEFRRVRHRTELSMARKELMKPPEQRIAVQLAKSGTIPGTIPSLPFGAVREEVQPTVTRSRSEGALVGLPCIFENPRRIEPTGSFSVTKWKFGEQ
ncbi:hypothetical protein Poli38472_002412 [Pythium oligandrum]|uniref:EF-hand domain-containing protein n=1 Tax=Pythium oligandrum TaxID=41045 RepID=A0A8K1CH62_PYTOL|nr:hypothetical protein Poli38472_002412 [Pythium oligandrum]|eukprot:TMW63471.1 hypothetical protein Poli38472_002412 [Pythium oligandrum]